MDKKYLAILLAGLAIPGTTYAAMQGSLGFESIGNFNIQVVLPAKVRISNLANFDLGTYGGSGDLNMDRDICVYTNTPSGRYRVTATGNGVANALTVTHSGTAIPYAAYWNDETGTTGNATLVTGTPLVNRTGANAVAEDCSSGGQSANIHVRMTAANLANRPNGIYTGILTLLIEPD